MKATDFKNGVLFKVDGHMTVLRFIEWRGSTGNAYQSVRAALLADNSYSVKLTDKGLELFDFIAGIEVKGFIPFNKCVAVQAVVTVNRPLTLGHK